MHHAVMRICISHRLSIVCAKNGVLGEFEGEDVKYCVPTPKGTALREYVSVGVSRVKIGSTA